MNLRLLIYFYFCRIHAWGSTLSEAFEQCANAMFHYMTEVDYIEMKESYDIEVEGHDMMTLLYNFLDELLFIFSAEPNYIARVIYSVHIFLNIKILYSV